MQAYSKKMFFIQKRFLSLIIVVSIVLPFVVMSQGVEIETNVLQSEFQPQELAYDTAEDLLSFSTSTPEFVTILENLELVITTEEQIEPQQEEESLEMTEDNENPFLLEEIRPSPETPPSPVFIRKYEKDIEIDSLATHECLSKPFALDVSDKKETTSKINYKIDLEGEYQLEIGSLPDNLDMRFENGEYGYELTKSGEVSLYITNYMDKKGSLNIPIIFSKKGEKISNTLCQVNI